MATTKCKVCGKTSDEAEFYASIKTYCKEHWKAKVKSNREANPEHYKEFDRNRANMPERIEMRKAYQKTVAFSESHSKATKKYKENHSEKRKAQAAIAHGLRDGKIEKLPCFVCGSEKSEAHHPNYDAPLDVIWLCDTHHKQTHVLGRKIERNQQPAFQ